MSSLSKSKHDQLLAIKDAYLAEHGLGPISPREMAEWAVSKKMYALPAFAAVRRCAEELAEAMRTHYLTDEHGHRVRVMHPATDGQGTLWDDIRTATREHMEVSVAQRRDGIVADVKQLKTDVDFYNRLHRDEPPLQLSFNFTNDLADAGLLDDLPAVRDLRDVPVARPGSTRGADVPHATRAADVGARRVLAPRKRAAARPAAPGPPTAPPSA
jgi:hypothetical protein